MSDEKLKVSKTIPWGLTEDGNFQQYLFESGEYGRVKLYVRKYGKGPVRDNPDWNKTIDGIEYTNPHYGVEASISWVVNPVDPFDLGVYHIHYDEKTGRYVENTNEVSPIRLDREGRSVGEALNSRGRDSSRPDGIISLDISSTHADNGAASRIGKLISLGDKFMVENENFRQNQNAELIARIVNDDIYKVKELTESLHHTTDYFDQAKYGTADGFAGLADRVMAAAEAFYANRTNQKNPNELVITDPGVIKRREQIRNRRSKAYESAA